MPLSEEFITALQTGHLSELRSLIIADRTLSPEIQQDSLVIYFRGKALLRLSLTDNGYVTNFESRHCLLDNEMWDQSWVDQLKDISNTLDTVEDTKSCLKLIGFSQPVMDLWISKYGCRERGNQQLVVQENNQDEIYASATDYFFCDLGLSERESVDDNSNRSPFDLIGVHCQSSQKQSTEGEIFVVAKVLSGQEQSEGCLVDDFQKLQAFVSSTGQLTALKEEVLIAFQQKQALGFMNSQNPLTSFSDESKPLPWLIILINHDPDESKLIDELKKLNDHVIGCGDTSIRIQVSSSKFKGCGLWDHSIAELDEFLKSF